MEPTSRRRVEASVGLQRWRYAKERLFAWLCFVAAGLGVILLGVLLYGIVRDGIGRLSIDFLTQFTSRRPESAGIRAALAGSVWVIALTTLIAVPVGVAAAVYLEELAKPTRITKFIELNIANLAGVPSIVYGLLGLAVFVRQMALGRSILAGALTMALLVLPVVIITTQEAIRAVPKALREGSLALGATPWQTVVKQTLRTGMPGILTGVILAVSRAMGETAPLITVGAVAFVAFVPSGPMDKFTVLPIQIFDWTGRPKTEFHELAAAGIIVLLAVLLTMNALAIWMRNRYEARQRG